MVRWYLSIARHGNLGKYCHKQVNAEKDHYLKPQRSHQSNKLENYKSGNRRNKSRHEFNIRQGYLRK
jgi:hypothetical protein